MPRYSKNGLAMSGVNHIVSPHLGPLGHEDPASRHSGRWIGGLVVFRKMLWTDDTLFAPNTINDELIAYIPSSDWGFYIMDAIVQAKIDTGGTSGSYSFNLGTNESITHNNVIVGPARTPENPAVLRTWPVNDINYALTLAGKGGRTAYRTYQSIWLRMDNSGFATLNNSPISVTIVGYILPDATISTA